MPNFVWKAKDQAGNPVVREISAGTSNEAQSILLAQGYTDLQLMQDEIGSTALEGMPRSVRFLGGKITVTAEERLKRRGRPPATFFTILRDGIGQTHKMILVLLGVAGFAFYRGNQIAGILLLIGVLCWLVFIVAVGLPSIYYGRLHRADDWHRNHEVLELVEKLENIRKFHFIKVPLTSLARFRAKAMARSGQLAEALRILCAV